MWVIMRPKGRGNYYFIIPIIKSGYFFQVRDQKVGAIIFSQPIPKDCGNYFSSLLMNLLCKNKHNYAPMQSIKAGKITT